MRTSKTPFKTKILKALAAIPGIYRAHILVSVSGGPDSTALLHFLKTQTPCLQFRLSAYYLDHGIRPQVEIATEIELIRSFCSQQQITFHCRHLEPGSLEKRAGTHGYSLEAAAREARYGILGEIAADIKPDFIALGHTQDDNIETIIMRFFQGSGYAGLTGIPCKRDRIIRPLLNCTKVEILQYLDTNALSYSIDSTNRCNIYLRNKVRHQLLPIIEEIFPGFKNSILSLSKKMHYLKDFIATEEKIRIPVQNAPQGFKIDAVIFHTLPAALKMSVIFSLYNKITGNNGQKLPFRFIKSLLGDNLPENLNICNHGIRILSKDQYLFFTSDIVYNKKKGYLIAIDRLEGSTVKNSGLAFTIAVNGKKTSENCNDLVLKKDLICTPLLIRSKMPGDSIRLKDFTKSLKKLFNDWKVPEKKRWLIPVVEDRNGILGIMGKELGYKNITIYEHNQLEPNEPIIKITIDKYGVNERG